MRHAHCADTTGLVQLGVQTVTRAHPVGDAHKPWLWLGWVFVRVRVCVNLNLRGAGVDILLLALRGKTAHGGGYGSRSPPNRACIAPQAP